jgi:hypothetical protein
MKVCGLRRRRRLSKEEIVIIQTLKLLEAIQRRIALFLASAKKAIKSAENLKKKRH